MRWIVKYKWLVLALWLAAAWADADSAEYGGFGPGKGTNSGA